MCENLKLGNKVYWSTLGALIMVSGVWNIIKYPNSPVVGVCILGAGVLVSTLTYLWYFRKERRSSENQAFVQRSLTQPLRLSQQRCGNVTERQTSHDMSSDANYNGLYLTIPPPLGFSGPESPPPSYEVAHVFDKPVQTPPPSYSAAVDLSGQPIWDHSYLPSQQHTPHVCETHAHSSLHVDDTHSHSTSN